MSPPSAFTPASAGTPPSTGVVPQVNVAFGRAGQGAGSWTQMFDVVLHDQRPAQTVVSRRSQTPSPGEHGSIVTQFMTGSQYSPVGQFESFGVCVQEFDVVLQLSTVQGTPSSQFIGMFVAWQKPARHARPSLPAQRFGAVQSELWTHGCIVPPPPSVAPSLVVVASWPAS